MTILRYISVLFFFICYSLYGLSAEIIKFPNVVNLDDHLYLYCGEANLDSEAESIIRENKIDEKFIPVNACSQEILPYNDYYLLLDLESFSEELENYFIEVHPSATATYLWFVDNDQLLQKQRSGTFTPVKERTYAPEVLKNIFRIDYNQKYPYLLIKIRSEIKSVTPAFKVKLVNGDYYSSNLVTNKIWNGFLYGFMALIALHGFILFFFLKDYTYFFYGLLTSCAIITITYINRDLADFIMFRWDGVSPKYMYFTKFFVYGFAVSYLLFIRYATRSNITFDKWRKIVYWIIMASIPFIILEFVLGFHTNYDPNVTVLLLNNYMMIVSIATLIFAVQVLWSKQRRYFLFSIGVVFMAAGIIATGLARYYSWIFPSGFFKLGVTLEIIFFSFGLGYNYHLLHKNEIVREINGLGSISDKIKSDKLLSTFFSYIKKNINKPELSIDDICRNLSISKAKLYRKLKNETDLTPIQIVNQLKMEEGMKLLRSTRLNISEVAYELGYTDPNYFTRRFTKFYGNPPSHFRNG